MTPFTYARATDAADAVRHCGSEGHCYLGGGTNLIDLMRKGVEQPSGLIDVCELDAAIEATNDGGLMIGAAARNSAVAWHPLVRERYPMLSRAILAGASGQIRNMATVGGNLLQRTRCMYFVDVAGARCNKRRPGSGCDARDGFARYHAILGASAACIATHPSDMAVALMALDAVVHLRGSTGVRAVTLQDFYRLPGDRPDLDTMLAPDELITAIELPPSRIGRHSTYRKVRDRASYAFALVAVAAGLELEGDRIVEARIALGGVAAMPWRALKAEAMLRGATASPELFAQAAASELSDAAPVPGNAFKVGLATRTLAAVLLDLSRGQQ